MKKIVSILLCSVFLVMHVRASHMTLGQKPPVVSQDRLQSLEEQLQKVTQELQACKTIVRSLVSVCKNMDEKQLQVQGQFTQLNEDYLRLLRRVNRLPQTDEKAMQVELDISSLPKKKAAHIDPVVEQ